MQKFTGYFGDNKQFFDNRKLFYSIILLSFISRLLIAIRPLEYIDGYLIPDDAYYVLKIAKNISTGIGPLCSGNFTNGFQPLFVLPKLKVLMILKHGALFGKFIKSIINLILWKTEYPQILPAYSCFSGNN